MEPITEPPVIETSIRTPSVSPRKSLPPLGWFALAVVWCVVPLLILMFTTMMYGHYKTNGFIVNGEVSNWSYAVVVSLFGSILFVGLPASLFAAFISAVIWALGRR